MNRRKSPARQYKNKWGIFIRFYKKDVDNDENSWSNIKVRKFNKKRGVAQLVARVLWEHDAAGSSPVTSTKKCNRQKPIALFA